MKKILSMTLAILFFALTSFGQKKHQLKIPIQYSIGVSGAVPVGKWSNTYTAGFGGVAEVSTFSKKMEYTLTTGFTSYATKTNSKVSYGAQLPILVGFNYNATKTFYVGAFTGGTLQGETRDFFNSRDYLFTYGPRAGVNIKRFDIEGKYVVNQTNFRATKQFANSLSLGISYSL